MTLTSGNKSHIQHVLAKINLLFEKIVEKLEWIETIDDSTPLDDIPDFNELAGEVRSWLTEAFDWKDADLLWKDKFPDYEINDSDKIPFKELFELWYMQEKDFGYLFLLLQKLLNGTADEDDFKDFADTFEFYARRLREYFEKEWNDESARKKLENLINQFLEASRFFRRMSGWKLKRMNVLSRMFLMCLLRRMLAALMNSSAQFLDSLGDEHTFRFREAMGLLVKIDILLCDVIFSSPRDTLPLIIPAIKKIKEARRYKHQLEQLINESATDDSGKDSKAKKGE